MGAARVLLHQMGRRNRRPEETKPDREQLSMSGFVFLLTEVKWASFQTQSGGVA